jgi:hypothetical protein
LCLLLVACFAISSLFFVIANASAPTILADAPYPIMPANTAAPAILTQALSPVMQANSSAPTLLANNLLTTMFAHAAALTARASAESPHVLADVSAKSFPDFFLVDLRSRLSVSVKQINALAVQIVDQVL